MRYFYLSIVFLLHGLLSLHGQVQLTIDAANKSHSVHPMIQGHGLVYSEEDDAIYSDGSMAQLYKNVGTGFLRWPGGTVATMYHWNDLSGVGWVDNWNPNYNDSADRPTSEYMDLDEYIALTNAIGSEPMLGINMSSGMEWNREADAIQEAKDMIQYCLDNNFPAKYFYLDNETYHHGNGYNKDVNGDGGAWTPQLYAEKINVYAAAIKSLVPDAILIANWTDKFRTNQSAYTTIINTAGDNIDYMDVHWYWKWGVATWDAWKETTPMQNDTDWYDGGTFVEEIQFFNNLTASLGKPHIKLASLEWNIAPGDFHSNPDHTEFKQALMQSEMHLQFIQGGLDLASLWTTQWANYSNSEFMTLVDSDDDYSPTPTAAMLELYKHAIGGEVVDATISDNQLMTVTVVKGDQVLVYILSKDDVNNNVEFVFNNIEVFSVEEAKRFADPGELQNIGLWKSESSGNFLANITANTLTMVVFNRDKNANQIINGDFEDGLNHWETWNSPVVSDDAQQGNGALKMVDKGSANQWVSVVPDTEYTLSAYLKTSDASKRVVLGVADDEGVNRAAVDALDTDYTLQQITFTTDVDETSVKVWVWQPPSDGATAHVDNMQLKMADSGMSTGATIGATATIKIYPNPAKETITIGMEGFASANSFSLYNAMGLHVYSQNLDPKEGDVTISIAQFSRGVYVAVILDVKGNKTYKRLVFN